MPDEPDAAEAGATGGVPGEDQAHRRLAPEVAVHAYGATRDVFWRLRFTQPQITQAWAGRGYAGDLVGWTHDRLWFSLHIVSRPKGAKRFVVLPRRWKVERNVSRALRSPPELGTHHHDDPTPHPQESPHQPVVQEASGDQLTLDISPERTSESDTNVLSSLGIKSVARDNAELGECRCEVRMNLVQGPLMPGLSEVPSSTGYLPSERSNWAESLNNTLGPFEAHHLRSLKQI
ncbi:hypothetical protein [Streptomyces sp. NPDC055210]